MVVAGGSDVVYRKLSSGTQNTAGEETCKHFDLCSLNLYLFNYDLSAVKGMKPRIERTCVRILILIP